MIFNQESPYSDHKYTTNVVYTFHSIAESVQASAVDDPPPFKFCYCRIVVVLENRISVFNFTRNPQELHQINTSPNPRGTYPNVQMHV